MSFSEFHTEVKKIVGTDSGLEASVKFVTDEGVVHIDGTKVPNQVSTEDLDADCALHISVSNVMKLLDGSLNAGKALMLGKVKIKGDMGVAMKIVGIVQKYKNT